MRSARVLLKLVGIGGLMLAQCQAASKVGFVEAPIFGAGADPYGSAVGDFNSDGKLDLAVASTSDSAVRVLLNKGNGTFAQPVTYPVSAISVYVAVGDFNQDGKLDLVAPDYATNSVSVLLGNGDGTFAPAVDYAAGAGPSGIALVDFNGDGVLDAAVGDSQGSNVTVLLGLPATP